MTTTKAELKFYGKRRAIVQRVTDVGTTFRVLSCGHRVQEPDGGQARNAQFAICRKCKDEVASARTDPRGGK